MDESERPALRFDHASLAYGRVRVVEDVHGEVRAGESVALIGPNGAGKSTLLRAVLGLVAVVGGRIEVLGTAPARARRRVAYVPQADTLDADFPVTAAQVVLMGRYRQVGWVRRPGAADRRIAAGALAAVGLADRAGARFGTLSGGQRQRVLLARAIAQRPDLLLLDEPFNGVDAVSQDALLAALAELRRGGAAVLISTHDLALAHLACDEVCLLNRHQVAFGPTGATLTPELLRAAYGGQALVTDGVVVAADVLSRLLLDPFASPFMQRALVEAVLLGVLGGVVSVFVVLRRLAFVSDVLTHTVFPGVVLGYLVAETGGIVWGALVFAVLSAVLLTLLAATARVTEDASMAVLLTGFFAVGVVLVSRRSSYTADLTAFLFGRILTVDAGQIAATAVLGAVVLVTLAVLGKELLLRAFDPAGAAALGYRVPLLDLALNLVVALVVVAAVRAVGTVLVIALLVVPGAAARLLSDRIAAIVALAAALGALGGWLGLAASYEASVQHGLRLASGATVVLALVALYLLAAAVAAVRSSARRDRLPA